MSTKFELATRFYDATLKMVGQKFQVDRSELNTNTQFHARNFRTGAGGFDGMADDTTQVLLARDKCQDAGGGVVLLPRKTRVRQLVLLQGSNTINRAPVYFRGVGEGGSVLLFDPTDPASDCFHFFKGEDDDAYCEGGVSDLTVQSVNNGTGKAIRLSGGYRVKLLNVWAHGFTGSGGLGLKVESEGSTTTQHLRIQDCHFQGNANGIDVDGVQEMLAVGMVVNQNTEKNGVIRGGTIRWYGGCEQGGLGTIELRPTTENSINLHIDGIYFEVTGDAPAIKGYPATEGFGYAGSVKIVNGTNNGSNTLFDFDHYAIKIEDVEQSLSPVILKARNSSLRAVGCTPFAAKWDLDASTLSHSTFISEGCIALGVLPSHPDIASISAKFALPVRVAGFTQSARSALVGVEENLFAVNVTSKVPQFYIGGRWRSLVEPDPRDIVPGLLVHFDARRFIDGNKWACKISPLVLTGVNGPAHEPDGKLYGGHPVWKTVAASSQSMDTGAGGPTLLPVGATALYARLIGRSSLAPAAFCTLLNLFDNAATSIMAQIMESTADLAFEGSINANRTNFGPPPAPDRLAHKFEVWLDPTTTAFAVDGVIVSTGATAVDLDVAVERISIGAFTPGSVAYATASYAEIMVAPGRPTTDQRAALDERDELVWGL